MQVLNRLELHVEQVADGAVAVGFVSDSIKLKIGITQSGFSGLTAEVRRLSEFDAVGRGLYRLIANLAGVSHGIQEEGRHGRLATGELHRHLAARLDGNGVVEQGLDVVPGQFVNESDLVRVHEARVAHHIATIGEVDRQHGTASMGDGGRAVIVQLLVVVGGDIAARERILKVLKECRVHCHQVFELTVNGAFLYHEDLAVALNDLGLDFAHLLVAQDLDRHLAVEDLLTDFGDALRAEGVRLTRPSHLRLDLFPGLQERLVGPFRRERRVRADGVDLVVNEPRALRCDGDGLLDILNWFVSHGQCFLAVEMDGADRT